MIQRRAITAPELLTYFEVYVKMFQADNKAFPKVNQRIFIIKFYHDLSPTIIYHDS